MEYLNNKWLEETVAKFLKLKKNIKKNKVEYEKSQKELAEAFYLLADNIIRAFNFQLIEKDDALQDAVLICFDKLDRFDPERGKIFNYMSTCIINQCKQQYRSCKNYIELKRRFQDHIVIKLNDKTLEKLVKDLKKNQ